MRFLEGVLIGKGLSVVYPTNAFIPEWERKHGTTIDEMKNHQDFQEIIDHMVTRCPNVYASRDQNAFLTIDRSRMISNFTEGYITDIERNERYQIVSNEMMNGIRYIGIQGILLPKKFDTIFKKGGMEKIKRDPLIVVLNQMKPFDIIQSCKTDSTFAKLCRTPGLFESLMQKHYPGVSYIGGARNAFNRYTKSRGILYGYDYDKKQIQFTTKKSTSKSVKNNRLQLIDVKDADKYDSVYMHRKLDYPEKGFVVILKSGLGPQFNSIYENRIQAVKFAIYLIRKGIRGMVRLKFSKDYDFHYDFNSDETMNMSDKEVEDFIVKQVKKNPWKNEAELIPTDSFMSWLEKNDLAYIYDERIYDIYMKENSDVIPLLNTWVTISEVTFEK
tara:strand:+ start:32199 stop:33359 length:1161 start_codon:yes stop_codon:yes gene_type:complete